MKRLISSVLAIALSTSALPKPVKANPAALAPAALCSTGVGCILVGTLALTATVVYIWQRNDGKKIHADAKGNVLRVIDDPSDFENESVIGTLTASDQTNAARQCKALAAKYQMKYLRVEIRGGKFVCIAK